MSPLTINNGRDHTKVTLKIKGVNIANKWLQCVHVMHAGKTVKGWLITELSECKGSRNFDRSFQRIEPAIFEFEITAIKIK
jgi:hypothetical protein